MNAALEAGIVKEPFTFHDLRAYDATTHKSERGTLPDLHANPAITARATTETRSSSGRRCEQGVFPPWGYGENKPLRMSRNKNSAYRKALFCKEFFGVADGTRTQMWGDSGGTKGS
ncbi:hypothetical protein [Ralstonia soli]|uniref:Integrase n=1 Tax=Ralstonia soli TaxID=2953896 RepID=A0ABT1ALE6_9RALS|nr:hypothetical protein [Ralstonia soli]MCO5399106.1 hypothetical protein [Ralstonia soli]